jgi:Tfp pilus assembly protein PilF
VSRIYNKLIEEHEESARQLPEHQAPTLTLVPPVKEPFQVPHFQKKKNSTPLILGAMILILSFCLYQMKRPHPHASLPAMQVPSSVITASVELAKQNKAQALFEKQDFLGAKVILEGLVATHPSSLDLVKDLAMTYLKLNEFSNAKKYWLRANRLSPDDLTVLNNLGSVFIAEGEWAKAIIVLEKALQKNPQLLEAHLNLAIALESSGSVLQAIDEYNYYLASPRAIPSLKMILKKRIEKIKSFSDYYSHEEN